MKFTYTEMTLFLNLCEKELEELELQLKASTMRNLSALEQLGYKAVKEKVERLKKVIEKLQQI